MAMMTEEEILEFEKKAALARIERATAARAIAEELSKAVRDTLKEYLDNVPAGSDVAQYADVLSNTSTALIANTESFIARLARTAGVQNPLQPNPVLPVPQAV